MQKTGKKISFSSIKFIHFFRKFPSIFQFILPP